MGKVGRNSTCPCGSGKKYKKCCGKKIDYAEAQKEFEVSLKEFISNSNYKYIYTTSTEIIFGYNEEYYEDEGREEFFEMLEKIKKDSRFKISNIIPDYTPFYPYFEILYLSSDCEQLNKDYFISEEFDFNDNIDLILFEIEMRRDSPIKDKYEKYVNIAKTVDEFIGEIDWYSIDTKILINSLKNIGFTEPFSEHWS